MEKLKRTTYTPRYPRWMIGRPLLIASSALASLGDAMFGYGQGVIAAIQVQPPFIKRFFGKTVTFEQIRAGDTGVDPFVDGMLWIPLYTVWNAQGCSPSHHGGKPQYHRFLCRLCFSLCLRPPWT